MIVLRFLALMFFLALFVAFATFMLTEPNYGERSYGKTDYEWLRPYETGKHK